MKLSTHMVIPAVLLALAACSRGDGRPAGDEESRTYPMQGFTGVSAETGIELILKQGPFSVEAQSHDGDLSRLSIETRGETLNVSSSSMATLGRSPTYTVTVSAPQWTSIEAAAGVAVDGKDLKFEDLIVHGSTGVVINLSGACRALDADLAAGAVLNAQDLECASADVEAAAGAKAEIHASEAVHARAVAGGVIDIFGNPPTVDKEAEIGGVITVH